nr:hypothetical protein [Tanacetum cinerariifolium]
MINQDIKDSKAYKTYLDFATRKATPKKARKFNKVVLPSKKLSPVLEKEPAKKPKQAKKPAKKSTTMQTASVVIRDTPGVSVSKKKASAKIDRGKGIDLISDVALLKATQLKKALKKRKHETYNLHASGLGNGVGFQLKVPDESQNKTTGTIPGVPDVPKYHNDDVDSDADGDNEASASERTDSNEDENLNLNQNNDEEEEYEEEYVRTFDNYEFTNDDEEYEELYKDVNVRLKDVEREEEGKGDVEITDAGRGDGSQEKSYEQVEDDSHVTLTAFHVTQKTESYYVSSDFASQFLNLDNVPPVENEFVSMTNVKVSHEEPSTQTPSFLTIPVTVISKTSTAAAPTIPPTILPITPLPQQSTPTPTYAPTTDTTTTLIPTLLDFSSIFVFDQRVFVLENKLSQLKQVDYSTQLLKTIKSQIPAMVDDQLSTRLEDSIQKAFRSYTTKFEKKAQAYYLKRDREDKDKDEDPPAGSDQGLKRRKTSKDAEPSKSSKSKESKSSSSKGTKSQPKSSAYVMNNLKIDNLTQEHLVGLAFNLLKGTCRSRVELEYHFKECYKAITVRLDWNNPKGQEYPFNLIKPLSLIEDRGRQVVSIGYFINNDLEYLKGRSSSKKYMTSTTKTKATKYDDIQHIKDMVPSRLNFEGKIRRSTSLRKVTFQDLRDIEDMLLLLVQKKIASLERDVIFELNVALQIFTRRVVILKRVEDLQLGVKSYQKKLNITKPETFRSDISKRTLYAAYKHQSDIKVFTMTREILPKPTSNKLCGSAAAKPCEGDSLEFYLITGSIYTDQQGTKVIPMVAVVGSRQVRIHSHMLILDRHMSLEDYLCYSKDGKLLKQIGVICGTSNLIYWSSKMAGLTEEVGPEG